MTPVTRGGAVDRWRTQLEGWAIPEEILAGAPEDPWTFPAELFAAKADAPVLDTPSRRRALEALPPGGSVLDVGAGAGAASLALVPPAGELVGVDPSERMLEEFGSRAGRTGVEFAAVVGSWPQAAAHVRPADVVVCHHVLYNVADVGPFVGALIDRARRRVVAEMTERHPVAWLRELWLHFHGLDRPTGPTAEDCAAALEELRMGPRSETFEEPDQPWGFGTEEDAVAMVRRRLCLPAGRDPEIREAIGDRLEEVGGFYRVGRPRRLVTMWWDP